MGEWSGSGEVPESEGAELERAEHEHLAHEPAAPDTCMRCGASGARPMKFMRVMSFLVVTRHTRYTAVLCPGCTAAVGAKELLISSLLGWWGIPWGLMTFGALWTNGSSLLRSNAVGRGIAAAILCGVVGVGGVVVRNIQESRDARSRGDMVSDETLRLYEKGSALVEAGRLEEALAPLRAAQAQATTSAAINQLLGFVELRLGQPEPAATHLTTASQMDPEIVDTLAMLSAARRMLGDRSGQRDALRRLVAIDERELDAVEGYLDACLACGARSEAQTFLRGYAGRHPDGGEAEYLRGHIESDPAKVVELMRAALAKDATLRAARLALGHALSQLRDYEAARAEYAKLDVDDPERGFYEASAVANAGHIDEALELLDQVMREHGETPILLMSRSGLAGVALRYDEAHQATARALELLGDVAPADRIFIEGSDLAWTIEEGRLDDALATVARLSALADPLPDSARTLLAWDEGLVHWQRGELEDAERAFARAAHNDGGNITWRTTEVARGLLLARLGRTDEATAAWRAVAADTSDASDNEQVPTARFLLGELDAPAYLAAVRIANPTFDNNAHYFIAARHELDGHPDDARASYQASIDTTLGHNFPWHLARQDLARLTDGR